jgi:hypothetical protein
VSGFKAKAKVFRDVGGKAGAAPVARMLQRDIGDGEHFMGCLNRNKPWLIKVGNLCMTDATKYESERGKRNTAVHFWIQTPL